MEVESLITKDISYVTETYVPERLESETGSNRERPQWEKAQHTGMRNDFPIFTGTDRITKVLRARRADT